MLLEDPDIAEAVEIGDLDNLVRLADGIAGAREWDRLLNLRDRCTLAVERGKQLWGVAHYCNFRLALEAPADIAGSVVTEPRGHMLPGPLTEVVASRLTWGELAPHLADTPERSVVAQERVLRGEDLTATDVDTEILGLPLSLAPWEGQTPLATYKPSGGTFDPPDLPPMEAMPTGDHKPLVDEEASIALADLGREWLERSNGRVEVVCVEGSVLDALATLGAPSVRIAGVTLSVAMDWMMWLAASGGAHGVRAGGATGRSKAWWALAQIAAAGDDWPITSDELFESTEGLKWFLWSDLNDDTGWSCRLAVEDPVDGLAWVLSALDAV